MRLCRRGRTAPSGAEFPVGLPGFLLLAVLLIIVVSGLVVVLIENRRHRTKRSQTGRPRRSPQPWPRADFDAAERSIRRALVLGPRTVGAVDAEPIA